MMHISQVHGRPCRYDSRALGPAFQVLPGGPEARHAASGEVWQYMDSLFDGNTAYHGFRHRDHPTCQRRVYAWVADTERGCELVQPWPDD